MMRWLGASLLAVTACTRPNPSAKCAKGTCTNSDFPFCDADGAIGGTPGACIAVSCAPNSVGECRDAQTALVCNGTGDNYGELQCEHGCDASSGCRACEPNQTTCANGVAATCDSTGAVVGQQTCALGCYLDQPRCRDIDPSNGLAMYLDMVAAPPDVDLPSAYIETDVGTITGPNGVLTVPTFLTAAPTGGVPIRVFVVGRLHLGTVTIDSSTTPGPAVAFLATGDILVDGRVNVRGVAGSLFSTDCAGHSGHETDVNANGVTSASGGGGHATGGAAGGSVVNWTAGGLGGTTSGTDALVPLRGGCPAGGVDDNSGPYFRVG